MSIVRTHGTIDFECDICGEILFTAQDDFKDALDEMKEEGWRAFKDRHDEWEHKCPDCIAGIRP